MQKEWGEKNGVTVNIKTCSGSCKISDQLKQNSAGTAPDVFVIEGQAGYDMWEGSIQPLKGDWIDKTEFEFKQGKRRIRIPSICRRIRISLQQRHLN